MGRALCCQRIFCTQGMDDFIMIIAQLFHNMTEMQQKQPLTFTQQAFIIFRTYANKEFLNELTP